MKKKLSLLALLFVAVSLALPYFSAAPARKTLIYSLETALSRQVRIQGATRIRLLPTPAILADEVTIAEDPSFSLEPFAYVTTIEVQPAFLALLSGRLEPARIRLTEPSVNLMRSSRGWNIESLISGKLRAPELEVRNGRLNFKQD
ncbi:MAG: AsmA family protein, partial [Acidobacteriota bacterium]